MFDLQETSPDPSRLRKFILDRSQPNLHRPNPPTRPKIPHTELKLPTKRSADLVEHLFFTHVSSFRGERWSEVSGCIVEKYAARVNWRDAMKRSVEFAVVRVGSFPTEGGLGAVKPPIPANHYRIAKEN